jgi:hypothetical protein
LKINKKEGYLFITGGPATDLKVHTVTGDKGNAFSVSINDSRYVDEEESSFTTATYIQFTLNEERVIALARDDADSDIWDEEDDLLNGEQSWKDIAGESAPDGYYVITVQDAK